MGRPLSRILSMLSLDLTVDGAALLVGLPKNGAPSTVSVGAGGVQPRQTGESDPGLASVLTARLTAPGIEEVHLRGPEILHSPDLKALLQAADDAGVRVVLDTLALPLSDDLAFDSLGPYKPCINFLMPSAVADVYDHIVGVADGFEAAEQALRNLKARGFELTVTIPLTAQSLPTLARTVGHLADEHSLSEVTIRCDGAGYPNPDFDVFNEQLAAVRSAGIQPEVTLHLKGLDLDRVQLAPARTLAEEDSVDVEIHAEGFDHDPYEHAKSVFEVHADDRVYLIVEAKQPERDYLLASEHHGMYYIGSFRDPDTSKRFGYVLWTILKVASEGPGDSVTEKDLNSLAAYAVQAMEKHRKRNAVTA